MSVTIQFIEANKMIIEQLEYFFFFINFDILLSKVTLNTGLIREHVHDVCMWEGTRQEDQIKSNEIW